MLMFSAHQPWLASYLLDFWVVEAKRSRYHASLFEHSSRTVLVVRSYGT